MNKQEFNQVGGFPMTTRVLDELQKAFSVFNGLGGLSGDKTIVSGCFTVGSTVSNGVVYVNGEVFEFRGGLAQTSVIIKEDVENLIFQNGNSNPVIKTRYVTFGSGIGAMAWVDFKRPVETKTLEASLLAVNNSLAAIFSKLDTIEANAKVQLQSDFNQTDHTKKDFIKNKPQSINYLYKAVYEVGDAAGTDGTKTVTFPNIGTSDYMVLGSMVSMGSNYNDDNDVIWMIREKTSSSFKIALREIAGIVQNLRFEYMLVPL